MPPLEPPEPPSTTAAAAYESRSKLEKVLSDIQLPFFKRMRLASWIELKILFRLAGSAKMVYLINNAMSMSTSIFSGHLGNLELAAAYGQARHCYYLIWSMAKLKNETLGNSGIQLFAYGLMDWSREILNGLVRSLATKKGGNSANYGGRKAADAIAREAKNNELILRSSGIVNVDGSNNFASIFSKKCEK
ncbi:hypothetical protein ACSBR2_018183 [Camellia fascicularis]